MINKKYEIFVFAFFMSLFMTILMSFFVTYFNMGFHADFVSLWVNAFLKTWGIAFPTVLIVVPQVRKIVSKLVKH